MLRRFSLALGVVAWAGCVELDPADDIVCESEGDCTSVAPGGPNVPEQWACLDLAPPILPPPRPADQLVGFVIPVLDWGTRTSLAGQGLFVQYCSPLDFDCQPPLNTYTTRAGFIGNQPLPPEAAALLTGLPISEGFFGFLKFGMQLPANAPPAAQFIPVTYYLGGSVAGDVTQGPPLLMLNQEGVANVMSQSFQGVDPTVASTQGIVVVGVLDCNGAPVTNARVEINKAGVFPFVLPASRIPIGRPADEPLVTGAAGLAGYLGVPPGAVEVRAFRGNDAEPFGIGEFGVVAGEISVFALRPAYLNNANVPGLPVAPPE
jgi:hypothetical protein